MRTTLAIDDDVLNAAKAIAREERASLGEVVSRLARLALVQPQAPARLPNGLPVFTRPAGSKAVVTLEIVNALRDDDI